MSRFARSLAAGAALALGIWCAAATTGLSADDPEDAKAIKEAQEGIKQLADLHGAAATSKAKAIAKKAGDDGLKHVMRAFKPKAKGGIGVGPKGESIELKIIALSKRAPTAGAIAMQSKDLGDIAKYSKAIAEITYEFKPKTKKAGKDPKDWVKYTDEMKKGADELAKAVQGGKGPDIKKAANNLNASCTNCHGTFRDAD